MSQRWSARAFTHCLGLPLRPFATAQGPQARRGRLRSAVAAAGGALAAGSLLGLAGGGLPSVPPPPPPLLR